MSSFCLLRSFLLAVAIAPSWIKTTTSLGPLADHRRVLLVGLKTSDAHPRCFLTDALHIAGLVVEGARHIAIWRDASGAGVNTGKTVGTRRRSPDGPLEYCRSMGALA